MNTKELAKTVADQHRLNEADVQKVIAGVLDGIATAAASGEEVSLPGFGKFKVKDVAAREGRNPSTGETIQIAASKKLAFTPAKQVKDAMNPPASAAAAPKGKAKPKKSA